MSIGLMSPSLLLQNVMTVIFSVYNLLIRKLEQATSDVCLSRTKQLSELGFPLNICPHPLSPPLDVWWLGGRICAWRPQGRRLESHSSRHVGTLGKSFTRSCLYDVVWRPA